VQFLQPAIQSRCRLVVPAMVATPDLRGHDPMALR
jgi:hypothetical protein